MPRLKPSKGRVVFRTPFPEELQRYLCYEVANAKQFNPDTIHGGLEGNGWKFTSELGRWTIQWSAGAREIVCVSAEPMIHIRQGLTIGMGNGRIIIHSIGAP